MTNHAERPRQRPLLSHFEQEADNTTVRIEAVKGGPHRRKANSLSMIPRPKTTVYASTPANISYPPNAIAGQQG